MAWTPSNDLESSNIGQHHTMMYQYWPASYYAVPILASIILRCTNIGQHHTMLYQYWPASYYAVPIIASVILRCTNIGQRHLPSGMSVASKARLIIVVYSRFHDICIYLYLYVCLHVNCTRPCTPYASPITSAHCALFFPGHWLLFGAPL